MSSQRFTASQREAIWLAHDKKCAYTRELLDVSSFHIDHVIPESLAATPEELERVKSEFGLSANFDLFGYGNLLPARSGVNLQKGSLTLDSSRTNFFLAIAASKKASIEAHLEKIERRNVRGKALILLQQCLERNDLDASEVAAILEEHTDQPEEIFTLLEGMKFADATEIHAVAKADIEALRDRPIRMGQNDHIDGVTLTNDANEQVHVRTCREYSNARSSGFYPYTTFDIKMATFFEHQCGLLANLQAAKTADVSFIANPRVGIVDLELLPFSLFPCFGDKATSEDSSINYQGKVSDGTIVVKRLRQNLLQVEEAEGMGQQLIEVARADFNGDGIEEILLFEYCWATHGTLGFGGTRILTRRNANGPFEIVAASAL